MGEWGRVSTTSKKVSKQIQNKGPLQLNNKNDVKQVNTWKKFFKDTYAMCRHCLNHELKKSIRKNSFM